VANMSYCRFRNTLGALRDCARALEEEAIDDLSEDEREACVALLKLCKRLDADWSGAVEEEVR
jgi:hypothetical protein